MYSRLRSSTVTVAALAAAVLFVLPPALALLYGVGVAKRKKKRHSDLETLHETFFFFF